MKVLLNVVVSDYVCLTVPPLSASQRYMADDLKVVQHLSLFLYAYKHYYNILR